MFKPYKLKTTLQRKVEFYQKNDPAVPSSLFTAESIKPDLQNIDHPLPSWKCDYTCCCTGGDGALWLGSPYGLTRIDTKEHLQEDRVKFFSKNRYLYDNNVLKLISDNDNGVWVETDNGVCHISMIPVSPRKKAEILLNESIKVVDRRGMMSQKRLAIPRDPDSFCSYGHSDNDGGFTAAYALAELFHYEVLKRENAPAEQLEFVKKAATRAIEACLLLMYISKRDDGFVARSYLTEDEPVPDDGLFYRLQGNTAVCLDTYAAKKRGMNGLVIPSPGIIPERLRKLYTDLGYDDDGLIYKGDTSSDELTHHFIMLYRAHQFIGDEDPELDEMIVDRANAIMTHIIDNGYMLMECNGKSTTWAKWNTEYFNTPDGWTDACLNSAELLMFIKATQSITGEYEKWQKEYDKLIRMGYADLPPKHYDRAFQTSLAVGYDIPGELMYGDNMLAVMSLSLLIQLEDNDELKQKYISAFRTWNGTLCREDTPGYLYPYAVCCGREEIDNEACGHWFERFNLSRLAAGVSLNDRFDIAKKIRFGGYEETSVLLPPDERFIAKFDRNPRSWCEEDSGGIDFVESCYVYTLSYWYGLYRGFIED